MVDSRVDGIAFVEERIAGGLNQEVAEGDLVLAFRLRDIWEEQAVDESCTEGTQWISNCVLSLMSAHIPAVGGLLFPLFKLLC